MFIKNKRGQSTVEYVLLVTAVVAVIIALVTTNKSGFQTQLNTTLNKAVGDMSTGVDSLSSSHAPGTGSFTGKTPYSITVTP